VESPACQHVGDKIVEQVVEQDVWRSHGRELLEALAELDATIPFALDIQATKKARAAKEREVQDWRITGILQGYSATRNDLEGVIDPAAIKIRILRRLYRSSEFDQGAVVDTLRAIRDSGDPVLAEQAQAIIAVPNKPDPRPLYPRAPLPRDREFSQRLCKLFRAMRDSSLTDVERNAARSQLERFNGDASDKSLLAGFLLRLAAWLERHPGEKCPPLPVSEAPVLLVKDAEYLIKHVAARQDRAPDRVDGIWNGLPAGI
jgi:hypothetical protein